MDAAQAGGERRVPSLEVFGLSKDLEAQLPIATAVALGRKPQEAVWQRLTTCSSP